MKSHENDLQIVLDLLEYKMKDPSQAIHIVTKIYHELFLQSMVLRVLASVHSLSVTEHIYSDVDLQLVAGENSLLV